MKTVASRSTVKCLPMDEARSLIQKAATSALKNLKKLKPFKLSTPIHLDIVFSSPDCANLAAEMPKSKLTDNRTISYTAEDYLEAWSAYSTALSLALAYRQRLLSKRLQESEVAKRIMEEWYKEYWHRWATEPPPFPPIK